ncbi:MAG: metallopeptidase family protein [Myxococcota bacterium]
MSESFVGSETVSGGNGGMNWHELLNEAETLWREGRHHDALQIVDRAALESEDSRYHAALLRGDVLLDLGDPLGALSSYESAADPMTPDPDVDAARGIALFELARFPESDNALRSAIRGRPDLAEAHYTLGLLYELLGNGREIEHFRIARRLASDQFPVGPQLGREDFERCIQEAVAELPLTVQKAIESIPVLVQDLPHPEDLQESVPPVSPRCLGLFVGMSPRYESVLDGVSDHQPVILLFKRNLERACDSRDRLVEEIKLTVLHEVGHALGLSEEQLAERGLD